MKNPVNEELDLDSIFDDVDRELAQRSLAEFAKQAWAIVEPNRTYLHNWHIDCICEHLQAVTAGQIRNLLINIPPRHGKTLLVSVFWPAWEWIRRPETRWIFASYAQSLSNTASQRCRRVIQSCWYQRQWGHIYQLTDDQNEKVRFENTKTGYRVATSVEGTGTGEGGDRIVCDDPHKVGEIESKAVRETALTWWDEEMSTRGNNQKTYSKVIIMQRCHEDDLSGHVLEQGGYEHLCLPMEFEGRKIISSIGWRDPRKKNGEFLWSQQFSTDEATELKRRLGSRAYAGQFQQRPSPAEGEVVKRAWWKYYQNPPANIDWLMISWDFTFKDSRNSDFVVGQVWARKGANKYLLDQVRNRMTFTETIQTMHSLNAKWSPHENLVEEKANGSAIIDSLSGKIPGIVPWSPTDSKESRAHSIAPQVEAGNIFLPDPRRAPWIHDFIEEWAHFPNGKHDDQVDAMTQAILKMGGANWWEIPIEQDFDFEMKMPMKDRLAAIFWPRGIT